jgi:hypothetical protein
MFTNMLRKRIGPIMHLHEAQAALKQKILQTLVRARASSENSKANKLSISSLDVRKAYDTVWRMGLRQVAEGWRLWRVLRGPSY